MSILKNLFTLIKGKTTEAGQSIVDKNAISIFEQQIRDAENSLAQAEKELASSMSEKQLKEKQLEQLNEKEAAYSSKMKEVVNQYDSATDESQKQKFMTLAQKLQAELEDIAAEKTQIETLIANQDAVIGDLKSVLKDSKRSISKNKSEIANLKSQESLNKANENLQSNLSNAANSTSGMNASMERIKQRQEKKSLDLKNRRSLQEESSGSSLEKELEAAGIGSKKENTEDFMSKFR
tara:strand:- start:30619 stop:31329 length:711 start_codon:yes stop_codon:yes gene_type:complete